MYIDLSKMRLLSSSKSDKLLLTSSHTRLPSSFTTLMSIQLLLEDVRRLKK